LGISASVPSMNLMGFVICESSDFDDGGYVAGSLDKYENGCKQDFERTPCCNLAGGWELGNPLGGTFRSFGWAAKAAKSVALPCPSRSLGGQVRRVSPNPARCFCSAPGGLGLIAALRRRRLWTAS
jgi:hypothetical protein